MCYLDTVNTTVRLLINHKTRKNLTQNAGVNSYTPAHYIKIDLFLHVS